VYHGTPHTLPPTPNNPLGEFDASKIGTGEGAQAYGHGIYTAENPAVATGYAEQLSTAQGPLGDVAKYWRKNGGEEAFRSFAKDAGLPPAEIEKTANVIRNTGNLYKIDLPDEKIAKMLDWDKPLSQQPANVQAALKGIASKFPEIPDFNLQKWMDADPLASTFHNVLNRDLGVDPALIASTFKEKGIPGIKYLDEGSRAAKNGTRNFVIFPGNEHLLQIQDINGNPIQ
jgi:hypothetical protein